MIQQHAAGEFQLREYVAVVRRGKWIVAACMVIVGVAAFLSSVTQDKAYRASADVLLQSRASERLFSPAPGGAQGVAAVQTEIEVMGSQSVRQAVIEELGYSPGVSVTQHGETSVVSVTVVSGDPVQAARAANVYAETYIRVRREQLLDDLLTANAEVRRRVAEIDEQLAFVENDPNNANVEEQELRAQRAAYSSQISQLELAANLTQTGGAQLVSEAGVNTTPFKPTPRRTMMLGVGVGLVLGIGLAFLREYLDDTIKTKANLEAATEGFTVLGLIPRVPTWRDGRSVQLVSVLESSSPAAEAYRTLRTSIQFVGLEQPIKFLQVTSPSAAEGKTTTLANLAIVLAQAGHRVIVVCCDLRRPRVHEFFGLDNAVGFTSVLLEHADVDEALQDVDGHRNLSLLASGPPPPNPSEVLSSDRARRLFEDLKQRADFVLIDSPPLLPVTDGLVIAGLVDATIMVTSSGRTTKNAAHRAAELLRQINAPVVGAVLNSAPSEASYGYGYGYGTTGGPRRPRDDSRPAIEGSLGDAVIFDEVEVARDR